MASEPDGTGACKSECGGGGPYEERIRKAREQCNPGKRAGLREFSWQERMARIEFTNRGSGWESTGRRWDDRPRLVSRDDSSYEHPCGTPQALYSPDFAPSLHASPDDPAVLPVCSAPLVFPVRTGSAAIIVEVTEVLQILRCAVSEKRTIGGNFSDSARAGDASAEASKRVVASAVLGGDLFQQRGIVLAGEPAGYVERLVETAAWGAKTDDPGADIAPLGRLSFAQAEYYFDHDGRTPREEWMWSRRWTARLRRVQIPSTPSWLGPASNLVPAGVMSAASELSSH
jgi:hypothetical protein